jgi:hypothetical protein
MINTQQARVSVGSNAGPRTVAVKVTRLPGYDSMPSDGNTPAFQKRNLMPPASG